MKGVDISAHNEHVDFPALKRNGIDFVIVRTGAGISIQDNFFAAVYAAKQAGLLVGAYHYSYALTPSKAAQEAAFCRRIINDTGLLLELPVFFDMEDADRYKARHGFRFNRRHITDICRAFLDNIGLNAGVYASYNWLEKWIDWRNLGCAVWNGQWGEHDFIQGMMWQYTDALEIEGQYFDGNILYDHTHRPNS